MAKQISIEEAVARAEDAQRKRVDAIRAMAQARTSMVDGKEQLDREMAALKHAHAQTLAELERNDAAAYNNARQEGWSPSELAKIGFAPPATATTRRPRKATQNRSQGELV